MKPLTIGLGFAAAIALALPVPVAVAEPTEAVVPPENSAASQYTEAVPTAGGNKQDGGGKGGHRSPAKVLGTHNAHELEKHGKQGREVAEVVADTAPSTSGAPAAAPAPEAAPGGAAGGKAESAPPSHPQHAAGHGVRSAPARNEPSKAPGELPSGSSGLGEVVAAATGSSSSGQLGALLPLAIVAAIVWALAYLRRQRRRVG